MKLILALLFAVCATAHAKYISKSPIVTLQNYYKSNNDLGRIIHGQRAKQGQFPWQVAVTNVGVGFCGGSLISNQWVLTAAHCVAGGTNWELKIGGILRKASNEPGSVIISTWNGFTHEDYNPMLLNNDIALIKLDKEVELSDTIQIIRLPSRSEVNKPLAHIEVTVSGWGKERDEDIGATENLNFVNLKTITNKRCAETYGPDAIISSTICAVGHPEHSTCNGDSGGPLIRIAEDGEPTQIGVVSFVHVMGCASGNPSGYVRTASFLDWINKHTGIPIRD